jgi:hypothetical protein
MLTNGRKNRKPIAIIQPDPDMLGRVSGKELISRVARCSTLVTCPREKSDINLR